MIDNKIPVNYYTKQQFICLTATELAKVNPVLLTALGGKLPPIRVKTTPYGYNVEFLEVVNGKAVFIGGSGATMDEAVTSWVGATYEFSNY